MAMGYDAMGTTYMHIEPEGSFIDFYIGFVCKSAFAFLNL